jgi:hypothetical protein
MATTTSKLTGSVGARCASMVPILLQKWLLEAFDWLTSALSAA